ncbi:MAG: hypothetical protein LAO24_21340 [Acidobacteriia bacterium]|nr:hypothetical protein [Terriglobia bacterium]
MSCRSGRSFRWRHRLSWLTLLAVSLATVWLAPPFPASAQDLARRLILKDGSYQLVTKYEVKGVRVRYLSAERNDWEELPTSLVDWPATEKYEKDRAAGSSVPEAAQLDKDLDAERELEEASLPQVAPGLRLPQDSGVFLFDSYKGEPQLVEVQQTAGDLNRNTKGNIFRGAINPVASAKQTIEIEGSHAPVQSHVGVPSIYLRPDDAPADDHPAKDSSPKSPNDSSRDANPGPQQPQQPEQAVVPFDRFRIVRADVKGGKRILGDVKRAITGKVSQEQHIVKTTINRVSGGWLKITPTEPLAPGEYALVEMMGKEGMNLYVWDFGVNPNAPANANPWKPDPKLAKPPDSHAK